MSDDLELKRKTFFDEVQRTHTVNALADISTADNLRLFSQTQMELLDACKRRLKPSPDMLGVERSVCTQCPTLCEAFEPFEVFQLNSFEQTFSENFVPLLCRNCKCAAHFHPPVNRPLSFPRALMEGLASLSLTEDHLNFHGILAVFEINYDYIEQQGRLTSFKEEEDKLYYLIIQGGFQIIARTVKILRDTDTGAFYDDATNAKRKAANIIKMTLSKQKVMLPQLSFKLQQTDFAEKLESPCLLLELCSTSYVNAQAQFSVRPR